MYPLYIHITSPDSESATREKLAVIISAERYQTYPENRDSTWAL